MRKAFCRGGQSLKILCFTVACGFIPAMASGETRMHNNAHPEIQMWSYPAGSSNGAGSVRSRGATFGAFSGVAPDTSATIFTPGTGQESNRRGSILIASDTSTDIPTDLAPRRYQIDSLRVTATLLGSLVYPDYGYILEYDDTLDDHLALTTGGNDDPGRPIEMYGIGLQGDYQTIDFGSMPQQNALQLGDVRWRPLQPGEPGYDPGLPANAQQLGPYQFFALDAAGRDAENSVTGGYSATEVTNTTEAFTPAPFAIGKLYDDQGEELAPGSLLENGDKFVFEPDLNDPRIVEYLQQSLAAGHLGFSFSSLHEPTGQTSEVSYPDFYLDDLDVGYNSHGDAPTIALTVTILDELLPGDYDGSGWVDALDYQRWKEQFGSTGRDADGNQDGVVDAADYTFWRDHLGTGTPPAIAAALPTAAVPEPSTLQIVGLLGLAAAYCGWVNWFLRPRRSLRHSGKE